MICKYYKLKKGRSVARCPKPRLPRN